MKILRTALPLFLLFAIGCTSPATGACGVIGKLHSSDFFRFLDPENKPSETKKQTQSAIALADDLAKEKPSEVADAAKTLSSSLTDINKVLESKGYDITAVSKDPNAVAQIERAQTKSEPATKAIDKYYDAECKK